VTVDTRRLLRGLVLALLAVVGLAVLGTVCLLALLREAAGDSGGRDHRRTRRASPSGGHGSEHARNGSGEADDSVPYAGYIRSRSLPQWLALAVAFLVLFLVLPVVAGRFRAIILPRWVGNVEFRYTVQFGLGLVFAAVLGTLPTVSRAVLRGSTGSTKLEEVSSRWLKVYITIWALGVGFVILMLSWVLSPEAYPRVLDLFGGLPLVTGVSASGPVWLGLAVTVTSSFLIAVFQELLYQTAD